jgi:hypothetical protein
LQRGSGGRENEEDKGGGGRPESEAKIVHVGCEREKRRVEGAWRELEDSEEEELTTTGVSVRCEVATAGVIVRNEEGKTGRRQA